MVGAMDGTEAFEVVVVKEFRRTRFAIRVLCEVAENQRTSVWLPLAHVTQKGSDLQAAELGDGDIIEVPEWLAVDRGLA